LVGAGRRFEPGVDYNEIGVEVLRGEISEGFRNVATLDKINRDRSKTEIVEVGLRLAMLYAPCFLTSQDPVKGL
jgi:hypothetical protein